MTLRLLIVNRIISSTESCAEACHCSMGDEHGMGPSRHERMSNLHEQDPQIPVPTTFLP